MELRLSEPGRVVPDLATSRTIGLPSSAGPPRVHVIAAGGAAMSAICVILQRLGWNVSGSDQSESDAVERLRSLGIAVTVGHQAEAVRGADLVVISTAVLETNVELAEARKLQIPVAGRPEVMEALGQLRRTIAISGTHGKTTTSAMAATAALELAMNPSFIVGGVVRGIDSGVRWAESDLLIVEADESDNSFLRFCASDVLITNIEPDHLDFHGSMERLEAAFDRFVEQASNRATVCCDDPGVRRLISRATESSSGRLYTYGFAEDADYRITNARSEGLKVSADICWRDAGGEGAVGGQTIRLELSVAGTHNLRNATGVFAALHGLGCNPGSVAQALKSFTGVGRRFEYRGEAAGVTFVDDYAHLPTEVSTVIAAARSGDWQRVVAVFQPHRYTRIRDVGPDFGSSFVEADVVVITGLYAAGQSPIEGVSGEVVAQAIWAFKPETNLHYFEDRHAVREFLLNELRSGDLCLTMNAGDLTTLPTEILEAFRSGGRSE